MRTFSPQRTFRFAHGLFLSHVDLCSSRVDPFLHAGLCLLMRIPILPTHGLPFLVSGIPVDVFFIRFAWRADSPQADLCASRADRFMLKTDLWPPPADLLRSSGRTLTTITTDLIHWN